MWKTLHKVPRTDGMQSKNKNKWREVSREVHEWASSLKEKSHTKEKETYSSWPRWRPTTRSKKMKRGTTSTSSSDNCAKERKEEDEARALLEEMQKKQEEAQARASATEQKLSGRYDEYMRTWTEDRGRPQFIMDKIWQIYKATTRSPSI